MKITLELPEETHCVCCFINYSGDVYPSVIATSCMIDARKYDSVKMDKDGNFEYHRRIPNENQSET